MYMPTLDEIIYSVEKDRNDSNDENERLKKIEAKRYEMTLGDEQDSLAEIKKDSLQEVEVVEEKQDPLEFLDEIITEMEAEGYKLEENAPSVEQTVNEREEVEETKEQEPEKEDRER